MFFIIVFLSCLFILLAFILTSSNAKYLLSGYNVLPSEKQEQVDIRPFIRFYRYFHLFLGFSFLGIGLLLYYTSDGSMLGWFIGLYPIVAYLFFVWKSMKMDIGVSAKNSKGALVVLVITILFVVIVSWKGFKANTIEISNAEVHIGGVYSCTIPIDQISSVQLLDKLPKIKSKRNGYAMGKVQKGHFTMKDLGKATLFIQGNYYNVLFIQSKSEDPIYFSCPSGENDSIYHRLKNMMESKH